MRHFLKIMLTAVAIVMVTATPALADDSIEKTLSYKFAEYFSNKDSQGMDSLLDDNIVVYDPGKITNGKENFLKLLQANFDKTKKISFNPLHLYQDGNTTVLEFKLSFDNERYNGVDIFVWDNNKIKEIRCYYYSQNEP